MRKSTCLVVLCITMQLQTLAQLIHNPVPASYNNDLQRQLVLSTADFLYASLQGKIDYDSAALLSAKVYNLSRLLLCTIGNENKSAIYKLLDDEKLHQAKQLFLSATGDAKISAGKAIGSYYLFKPGSKLRYLDSAFYYLQPSYDLSVVLSLKDRQCQLLNLLGSYYIQANNGEQARQCFEQNVATCRKNNDVGNLGHALIYQCKNMPVGIPGKLALAEEANKIFISINNPIKQLECETAIATEYFYINKKLALARMPKILELENKIGLQHHQFVYNSMAYLYMGFGKYLEAHHNAELAIKWMEKTRDTAFSPFFCQRMQEILSNAGRVDMAGIWADRALSIPKNKDNQIFWYTSFISKAFLLYNSKPKQECLDYITEMEARFPPTDDLTKMYLDELKAECHISLGQDEPARTNYLAVLDIAEKTPTHFLHQDVNVLYQKMGLFFFRTGDYGLAKKMLAKIETISFDTKSILSNGGTYLLKFKFDSLNKNYVSAIQNYQQFKTSMDSFTNVQQRKKLDELMVQYEAAKKDNDIKLLTQAGELQKSKLTQANNTRNITIAIGSLLAIIMLLLYNQYINKQKTNRETELRNIALQKLVDEKEWLLKEVHHRVKNNLQTVVSLLESQSAYLQNDALLAIQDSQNRVYAMSLIHQKLYQSENVATINMAIYLPELVNYLRESFNVKQQIQFHLNIQAVEMDVSQAVPVGLIVNEAVTNSIKYAFQSTKNNIVSIQMEQNNGNTTSLIIADNGVGIPNNYENKHNSLGLRLMRGLSEDIEGEFEISNQQGTRIVIRFKANTPLYTVKDNSAFNITRQAG